MLTRALRQVSAAAVLTLTVGLGANIAVLAVAHRVLAAPPDRVADPSTIFTVRAESADAPGGRVSEKTFDALRQSPLRTIDIAASIRQWGNVRMTATAVRASVMFVDAHYFDLLGVVPLKGQFRTASLQAAHGIPSVVSERIIARVGTRNLDVGDSLCVNGVWTTVAGIVPRQFDGLDPRPGDVWIPLQYFDQMSGLDHRSTDQALLGLIARLHAGETPQAAESELSVRLGVGYRAVLERVTGIQTGDRSGFLAMSAIMQAAVALLAAIAIVNAAGVTYANYMGRQREFAVRLALGSSHGQLVRSLIADAAVLAGLSLTLAVPVGAVLLHIFGTYLVPEQLASLFSDVRPAAPVLCIAAAIAIVTSAITVLIPGIRIARAASVTALTSLQTPTGGLTGSRRRFVVLQTSLAVALMATMGLLVQTIHKIAAIPPGTDITGVFFGKIEPRSLGYTAAKTLSLTRQLPAALDARPELAAWAIARQPPLQSYGAGTRVVPEGATSIAFAQLVGYNVVSSNYFAFLRLPMVAGRGFDASDQAGGPPVAIVNETMARTWSTPAAAIGASVRLEGESFARMIIGVVKDAKYVGLTQPAMPYFYLPVTQEHPLMGFELTLLARVNSNARQGEAALAGAVSSIDPELALFGFMSMERQMAREVALQTLLSAFVSVVGGLALLLVCLGLHGGLAQTLAQTQRTMAVRLALGATPRRLQAALMGRVLAGMGIGAAIGMSIAFFIEAALGNILMSPSLADPAILLLVLAAVVICALSGAAIHVWKVGRLQPNELLREA